MAQFVVAVGLSPSEYYNLTLLEREALIKAFNESRKNGRG